MRSISEIRPSPIAGQWYSGNPATLAKSIDGYLASAQVPALDGEVVGLMVPHAGHIYSGPVAAYGFKTVLGKSFDVVAVVSPLHAYHPDLLLTSAHSAYATPLGSIAIDQEAVNQFDESITSLLGFHLTRVANDSEHSLEIELPFLQRALSGSFKLLPIMMRDQTPLVSEVVGHALAKMLQGRSALLVASSDLSHFYTQRVAEQLDQTFLEGVAAYQPAELFKLEAQERGFACGLAPIAAVMWAATDLGATHAQILNHATSGDVTGDFSSVVGYGAAAFVKGQPGKGSLPAEKGRGVD